MSIAFFFLKEQLTFCIHLVFAVLILFDAPSPLFDEPPKSKYYREDDCYHGENDTCGEGKGGEEFTVNNTRHPSTLTSKVLQ